MPEVAANSARDVFIDTRTLMQIRSLELRARIVVQGFWNGIHRSPYHGFSVEFTEYRQYVPGDDPRYVDWRVYARSDRYYIKKFEDETNGDTSQMEADRDSKEKELTDTKDLQH